MKKYQIHTYESNQYYYFSLTFALVYFLYQTLLIFSSMSAKKQCLFPLWRESVTLLSIFECFLLIALNLVVWLIYLTWKTYQTRIKTFWLIIIIAAITLGLWLNNLHKLNMMLDVEQGFLPVMQFLEDTGMPNKQLEYMKMIEHKPVVCNSGT